MQRPEKKSEFLEVRVSFSAKRAFMEKCRERGTSASEELRGFIDRALAEPAPRRRTAAIMPFLMKPAAIGAALAPVAAVWLAMAPTPVSAQPDLNTAFAAIYTNHDEAIDQSEFGADGMAGQHVGRCSFALADRNHNGRIEREEFAPF